MVWATVVAEGAGWVGVAVAVAASVAEAVGTGEAVAVADGVEVALARAVGLAAGSAVLVAAAVGAGSVARRVGVARSALAEAWQPASQKMLNNAAAMRANFTPG